MITSSPSPYEGILLVDKPKGNTSFNIVAKLRRLTKIKKIGHAGTLDPMATGVMVMLLGKKYTKQSDSFLCQDKEYYAVLKLGQATNSFDAEGILTQHSSFIPSIKEIHSALSFFEGKIEQIPPMFSAKKLKGKKLCDLARKGIEIERAPQRVEVRIAFEDYQYPLLKLKISCSKGTYIRSLAHDIGVKLGSFAHLIELRRLRSGNFHISECIALEALELDPSLLLQYLQTTKD